MASKEFIIERGLVEVAGERSLLVPSIFITALQDAVMREKGVVWREMFYQAGKKAMEEIAPTYKLLMLISKKPNTPKEKLAQGLVGIWSLMSCGRPEIVKVDLKKPYMVFRLHNSIIGRNYGGRGEVMCNYLSGMVAGGFGSVLGMPLRCQEVKCIAKGDEFCEFEVRGV